MSKIKSLDELAKMLEEYAVVSLKFVKSFMMHPKQADRNAKLVLKKAGFVRGRQISLKEPANASGVTNCICYWRKDYFDGKAPAYKVMQELANKKLTHKAEPVVADQPKQTVAPKEPVFDVVPLATAFRHLRGEAVKTYLRTLPPDHQRVFCFLFESVFQDLSGVCTLKSEEDNTVHVFEACPLSEEARRYYNPLINMFYQDEEMWGPFVLWLELNGKPDVKQEWKSLLQPPYSKTLLSSYFFLTDLDKLFGDELTLLAGLS